MWRQLVRRGGAPCLALAACGAPGAGPGKPPELVVEGTTKCKVQTSADKPLIIEWPSSDRVELEARIHEGAVLVHYDGCEMRVLPRCKALRPYAFRAVTPKSDSIVIRDSDELWAAIPLGAAALEGKLESTGRLELLMLMVGRWSLDDASVGRSELLGDCAAATHVVRALTVGAFQLSAGSENSSGAGIGATGMGFGATHGSTRDVFRRDGEVRACSAAAERGPPSGCGALLRVEVEPLSSSGATAPAPSVASTPAVSQPGPAAAGSGAAGSGSAAQPLLAGEKLAVVAAAPGEATLLADAVASVLARRGFDVLARDDVESKLGAGGRTRDDVLRAAASLGLRHALRLESTRLGAESTTVLTLLDVASGKAIASATFQHKPEDGPLLMSRLVARVVYGAQ